MAEKYIEVLEKTDYDSYFELNYRLTVDVPENLLPYYNSQSTISITGKISCNLTDTANMIKSRLLGLWNDYKNQFEQTKQWKYYGTYYNGTSWIIGGTN